jgi:hypothetical protein
MAHKDLESAITEVQKKLRSLSDYAHQHDASEFEADLFAVVNLLANVVEGLVRGVDYPMEDGQSVRAI